MASKCIISIIIGTLLMGLMSACTFGDDPIVPTNNITIPAEEKPEIETASMGIDLMEFIEFLLSSGCTIASAEQESCLTISCIKVDGTMTSHTICDGKDGVTGSDGTSCVGTQEPEGCLYITCGLETFDPICSGRNGTNGKDGHSCTVAEEDGYATLTCEDGTSVTWWVGGVATGCEQDLTEFAVCGLNKRGYKIRTCLADGAWDDWSECYDYDICVDGHTSAIECWNNPAIKVDAVCVYGWWDYDYNLCVWDECVVDADCDDDNTCNGDEVCSAGLCYSGTPLVCDDNDPSTLDSCDPTVGCVYTPIGTTPGMVRLQVEAPGVTASLTVYAFFGGLTYSATQPFDRELPQSNACMWGVEIAVVNGSGQYWGCNAGTPSKSTLVTKVDGVQVTGTFVVHQWTCQGAGEGNLYLSPAQLGCSQ